MFVSLTVIVVVLDGTVVEPGSVEEVVVVLDGTVVEPSRGVVAGVVLEGTVVEPCSVLAVVVVLGATRQPAFQIACPSLVQFLPAYCSVGPKSNGGMMSPHCWCLGMPAWKTGPLWPS